MADYKREQSRIPVALQIIFLKSNRGFTVDRPSPDRVANRVFSFRRFFSRERADMKRSMSATSASNTVDDVPVDDDQSVEVEVSGGMGSSRDVLRNDLNFEEHEEDGSGSGGDDDQVVGPSRNTLQLGNSITDTDFDAYESEMADILRELDNRFGRANAVEPKTLTI